jgi:hypothetical protein
MKKIYALYIAFFAFTLLSVSFSSSQSFAAGSCSSLYNGGITDKQFCPTPTILPTPAPFKENLSAAATPTPPQQTKGGQKIYPASKSKTTPSTGPEEWSLPALFLLGGIGFLLRRKAKYHLQMH